eukprot:IDg4848t1
MLGLRWCDLVRDDFFTRKARCALSGSGRVELQCSCISYAVACGDAAAFWCATQRLPVCCVRIAYWFAEGDAEVAGVFSAHLVAIGDAAVNGVLSGGGLRQLLECCPAMRRGYYVPMRSLSSGLG